MPPASLPTPADLVARSLYAYENQAINGSLEDGGVQDQDDVQARSLYTYVNRGAWGHPAGGEPLDGDDVLARSLYAYESRTHDRDPSDLPGRSLYAYESRGHDRDPSDVAARALYPHEAYTDGELFPWIERIVPTEQVAGGTIDIHGDGFGPSQAEEDSTVRFGSPPDPTQPGPGVALGVVSWSSRSPGLWPANSGIRSGPAITATLPTDAESGMVSVEQAD